MATITEEGTRVSTRKYEAGTAYDHNRVFKSYDNTVEEIQRGPSPVDLELMLRNDPQPRQLATALKLPLRSAKFDILAETGDNGERDFIEFALTASRMAGGMTTPMREVIAKMANGMIFRFAPFEKVWKVADRGPYKGKVVLHKLAYRPPATCKVKADKNGSFDGFQQRAYKGNNYKTIDFTPQRSLVFIHGSDEMPLTGMTPFDTIWNAYQTKRKISFFYYAFLENVAFPRTMARVASENPDDLDYLLSKVRKLASQGAIGLYEDESIEAYESKRSTSDYQSALEYLDWQMAKAVLGQFLDLGTSGERGSFALSKDKSSFFFKHLDAVLEDMASVLNTYLIPDLVQYNFGRDAAVPRLRFRPINDDKSGEVLEIFKNVIMSNAPNITPPFLLELMSRVEEILDFEIKPLKDYDFEDLAMISQTIPTAMQHLMSKEARAGAGQNPVTGEDRNGNNEGGAGTVTEKKPSQKSEEENKSDLIDLITQAAPSAPTVGGRQRKKKDEDE